MRNSHQNPQKSHKKVKNSVCYENFSVSHDLMRKGARGSGDQAKYYARIKLVLDIWANNKNMYVDVLRRAPCKFYMCALEFKRDTSSKCCYVALIMSQIMYKRKVNLGLYVNC